jgi:hypothetical protein
MKGILFSSANVALDSVAIPKAVAPVRFIIFRLCTITFHLNVSSFADNINL